MLEKPENSTNAFSVDWWEKFVKFLIILPCSNNSHQIFIETLKNYYQDNKCTLCMLEKFDSECKSEDAILWFTRDTFLYRLLNQALRQHNIEVMFLLSFYVQDFYRQMKIENENFRKKYLENPCITLYRGQIMRLNELERLKVGDTIINNSFLSSTFKLYYFTIKQ
ncbi:hypothetical protein I4U23_004034 [Adineta vaga]|nr:hypothetical protein I4U23_004034 [Adineta vaga]